MNWVENKTLFTLLLCRDAKKTDALSVPANFNGLVVLKEIIFSPRVCILILGSPVSMTRLNACIPDVR